MSNFGVELVSPLSYSLSVGDSQFVSLLLMKNIVVKKFVSAWIIAAVICAASSFTAKAALEVTVSDAPVSTVESTPAVPASDFNGTSATPAVVKSNPAVVIPEPGTMFAGLGVLTYFLLKPARRSRR